MANAPPEIQKTTSNGSSSNLKRAFDDGESGSHHHQHKRRERDVKGSRDWRDVHLGNGGGSGGNGSGSGRSSRVGERDRDRERHRRERDRRYRDRDYDRPRERSRSPRPQASPTVCSEKEEGEISPRPRSVSIATPPPVTPAPEQPTMQVEPELELELAPSPPPVEQTLAERRARRAAILARHTSTAAPPSVAPSQAVSRQISRSPSPEQNETQFTLAKADETAELAVAPEDQVNAADYDPSLDRREDEFRRVNAPAVEVVEEEMEYEEDEDEDEDLDDMFSLDTDKPKKKKKVGKKKVKVEQPANGQQQQVLHSDAAADPEGYYTVILGEVLVAPGEKGERYQVYASVGRGMFAVVVRARVLSEGDDGKESKEGGREVAIKIVRAQEVMHRAGLKESAILTKLQAADPEDKRHIVRLERTFEHRGHLCLVFESMSMNLRDVVKRFGKDVGLNIRAVRAYAHQLFIALGHLRKLGVMHADIKPDNILVNDAKTMLKLCDLGSASDAAENDITPYLVSRFYRAPEIILGVPYDPSLDVWSVGCTLYELYTGKILFPGRSNNQMLLHMMELKGRFNGKMIKKAKFGDVYFDEMGAFESVEKEKGSGNDVVRKVHISKPAKDLRQKLLGNARLSEEDTNVLLHFIDLLDRCLALDPARRITPREALSHPFIRGSTK
ncbi:unnamed protein product [Mycena citricolor]|uniref:non-specific serine/threonine protein kinase n=1 Tax=Mycena citricolor TaxID=2018698 RepID=A0AAD2GTY0_9AGAR|nr:unnamed protein product [Mycena citricolor]